MPPGFYNPYDQQVYDAGFKYIPQSKYLLNPFKIPQGSENEVPTGIATLGPARAGGGGGEGGFNPYSPDMSQIRTDFRPDYDFRRYSEYGQSVYREGNLRDVATTLSELAEQASVHTIQELEDDFDKITVGRNMKELKGYSDQFNKFATEANTLQQRIESLYEDMGTILNRYYHIDELEKKIN